MSQYLPLFPSTILSGYSAHKRPTFASMVQSPPSGREVTGFQQIYPLWEFELPFEILRDQTQNGALLAPTLGFTDLQVLSTFWLSRVGQFSAFIYQDLDDCSRLAQAIGTGDNTTKGFPVVRQWGGGALGLVEPVGIVDVRLSPSQAFNVYLNGVSMPQSGNWWIDTDLRTLKFKSAPAAAVAITADFGFFYLCRFIDDALDLEQFMSGRWTVKSLKFRSIAPGLTQGATSTTAFWVDNENTTITTAQ